MIFVFEDSYFQYELILSGLKPLTPAQQPELIPYPFTSRHHREATKEYPVAGDINRPDAQANEFVASSDELFRADLSIPINKVNESYDASQVSVMIFDMSPDQSIKNYELFWDGGSRVVGEDKSNDGMHYAGPLVAGIIAQELPDAGSLKKLAALQKLAVLFVTANPWSGKTEWIKLIKKGASFSTAWDSMTEDDVVDKIADIGKFGERKERCEPVVMVGGKNREDFQFYRDCLERWQPGQIVLPYAPPRE